MIRCAGATRRSYLLTAEALEKRAEWLAATLPRKTAEQDSDPGLHKPVDVII